MTTKALSRAGAALMIGLLIFLAIRRYFDSIKLNKEYLFTVATVYNISHPAEGGPLAEFKYCVNQRTYKDYTGFNTNDYKITIGDKFLLKYHPSNPKVARIQIDEPLDSSEILKQGFKECGKESGEP